MDLLAYKEKLRFFNILFGTLIVALKDDNTKFFSTFSDVVLKS